MTLHGAGPVVEGAEATFTVRLSAATTRTVTATFRTLDGTALAGSDYRATEGTVRLEPGETMRAISVSVLDDHLPEATEQFWMELRDPSGASLADGTGSASVIDNDEPPTIAIDDAPPVKEGETARYAVRLSGASGTTVAVSYRTADGTAVAGADYRSRSGRLRFEPGETSTTLTVPVLDDELSELTEFFTVELHAPSEATLADRSGLGTIVDDDEPPELAIDDAPGVAEGAAAEFPVRLSTAAGRVVTVSYRTVDGTAVAGADYTSGGGTIRFEPGETRLTVAVPTLVDELVEGAERFTVELDSPVGATLVDGSGVATLTDDAEQRIEVVNRTLLPEIGRALAFPAVRCRIGQGPDAPPMRAGGVIGGISLAAGQSSGARRAGGAESLTFEHVLGGSSFLMPSSDAEGGPGRFAAWGCGDYRNLAGEGGNGAVAWDAEVLSLHVGADVRLGAGVLAGLSVSRSMASLDYFAAGGAADESGGAYEVRLVGVHPYLSWSASPDLDVWGTVGHAWGWARIVDDVAGDPRTSAATLNSAAVGVSGRLLSRGATTLRVNGEGALAQMDLVGAAAIEAVTVDMQRVRVSTEASHRYEFSSGASLTPWGELGVRHDDGDGETGAGVEVGGGLRYRSSESAWTVEGYGRRLVAHEAALREWGLGALIRFDPGSSGRGPQVSLMPAWGDTASGVHRLWEHGATDAVGAAVPGTSGTRLDAQVGYGFGALGGRGVLTPYGAVSLDGEEGRGYRVGWRLAVSRTANVSLEAERRERTAAPVAHAVLVRGALRF